MLRGRWSGSRKAKKGSQRAARDPVELIKERGAKVRRVRVDAGRVFGGAQERVGLVGERKHHIGKARAHRPEAGKKAQAIEHVPAVDDDGHGGRGQ